MAKKKPATHVTINLHDEGMTALHRAGLAGLAATLERLPEPALGVEHPWDIGRDHVTLRWGEDGPEALLDFVLREGLAIDEREGIIDFPALRDRLGARPSYEARLAHQKALTQTFLQHGSSRKLEGAKLLVLDPDADAIPISYRPMVKFNHQEQAETIAKNLNRATHKKIRFAGWAYPGAAEKHPGSSWSRMQCLPGPFLALCFAPVGCFTFLIHSDSKGNKLRSALVIPEVHDLKLYSRMRRRLNSLSMGQLTVSSLSDAALMISLTADSKTLQRARRHRARFCEVFGFGIQAWASQQKTRTFVARIEAPSEEVLHHYKVAQEIPEFATKKLRSKRTGNAWFASSVSRGAITDALVHGEEWWQGVARTFRRGSTGLREGFLYPNERAGLREMLARTRWTHRGDLVFIEACHQAMSQMYGAIQASTRESGASFERKAEVELATLRVHARQVRNEAGLYDVLADLWLRAGGREVSRNAVLTMTPADPEEGYTWASVLPLLDEGQWERARDLLLVAILTYEAPDLDDLARRLDAVEQTRHAPPSSTARDSRDWREDIFIESIHDAMTAVFSVGDRELDDDALAAHFNKARKKLDTIRLGLTNARDAMELYDQLGRLWARARDRENFSCNKVFRQRASEEAPRQWAAIMPILDERRWERTLTLAMLALVSKPRGGDMNREHQMEPEDRKLAEGDLESYLPEVVFVRACHAAMRNLFGQIGKRTSDRGESFDRKAHVELNAIRSRLLRARTHEQFQREWSRLLTRTGVNFNHALRESFEATAEGEDAQFGWQLVLPLLDERHWRKARMLTLMALVTYSSADYKKEKEEADDGQGESGD